MLPLMLGLETYCHRETQGTPENSPGQGVSWDVTMWKVLNPEWKACCFTRLEHLLNSMQKYGII